MGYNVFHITSRYAQVCSFTKTELRQQLLNKRQSLPKNLWRDKSDHLCQNLQSLPLFASAKTVLAYTSFRQEPDLTPLFPSKDSWGLPRCVGKSLVWHRWQPSEPLEKGVYGILEPNANFPTLEAQDVDLILIPAVGCDRRGYRLGYGGGFYDRLLSSPQWQHKPTIAIVFEFALVSELPVDSWDKPLQGVCTEVGFSSFLSN